MAQLSEQIDFVIGVDTHTVSHTAAVVNPTGRVVAETTVPGDAFGAKRIHAFGHRYTPHGAKSDELDAAERLGRRWPVSIWRSPDAAGPARRSGAPTHPAGSRHRPHQSHLPLEGPGGHRAGAAAPSAGRLSTDELLTRCARLRTMPAQSLEHRATILALRMTARRALALEAEAVSSNPSWRSSCRPLGPHLLREPGVGAVSGVELLCAWSHRGRLRSEAAFAALVGVAPMPASSGQIVRHRLNRRGDRQLNRALHTIVLSRPAHHAETRAYAARRAVEVKTDREIRHCLKRHLARRLFKLLERTAMGA